MSRILLVEDHDAFCLRFELVYGDRFDHCYTIGEMATRGRELELVSETWDYAFIDFHLEDRRPESPDRPCYTGFGALEYLRTFSPTTKVIVFTSLGEKGRTLFALAAKEWFDAWTVLDKRSASNDALRQVAAGEDPSPQWRTYLDRSSVVNELFKKEAWLQIWKLFALYDGRRPAICKAGQLGIHPVREFSEETAKIVASIKHQIPLIATNPIKDRRDNYDPIAVSIVSFYRAHHNFFEAPELPEILETVAPWRQSLR